VPQVYVEPKTAAEPGSTFYHWHPLPISSSPEILISALPSNRCTSYRHLLPMGAVANRLFGLIINLARKSPERLYL
jgi:hypothetical protein